MKQINWGIIGCGDVCEVKSGPAFQLVKNSTLAAVMRRDEEKLIDFATRHSVSKWYTNADDLIHDEQVNAIYIATPPNTHANYAIKAMEAGKPVYVEKPMALSYAECLKMIEVSKKTGVPMFVAYYRRFFPYFLKIKEILDFELIGTVLAVNLTTILPPRAADHNRFFPPWHLYPEIAGAGYFFDMGCHQLDILDFLLGPIENVNGMYTNRHGIYGVEDTLAANLQFKSGVLGSCIWTYVGNKINETDRIEIYGIDGKLSFSISTDSDIQLHSTSKNETYHFDKPKHVEMPMIEQVTASFLGLNKLKTNMESAAQTSWVMDRIMGRV